ncbi:hypothetical protein SAMD00019534_089560, partial [Acytostelium subglobosum LB1]|uniref:hypothetical protein n=1 Tax=Acytostelium subglobosum LB1 TaxID=1410327 RepID=UPI000644C8AF
YHSHGAGINAKSGMTIDGSSLDPVTGNFTRPRWYTVGSKESIQLAMLALALNGVTSEGYDPLDYFHYPIDLTPEERTYINTGDSRLDNVLGTLYRKIATLEKFNKELPGYGGYIPWIGVVDSGLRQEVKADASVPSLDEGQMAWGLYAVAHVLGKKQYKDHTQLGLRYRKYFDLMADNAFTIFFNRTKNYFAMSAFVGQNDKPVAENHYRSDSDYPSVGPWDGECMGIFGDLFAKFETPEQREKAWTLRIDSKDWTIPPGTITVQKGWTYSAHEAWKYFQLPYHDVPIQRRLLANCEKARTWYSHINKMPGFGSAAYNTSENYVTSVGIPPLATGPVQYTDFYTPYGGFPVLMANHTVGLVWYNNMLKGPAMQGPYGSTESALNDGTAVCSKTSWDTKASIVAILGGTGHIVKEALILDCKWQAFYDRIQTTYSKAFPVLLGEDIPYALPNYTPAANSARPDYTLC